MGIIVVHMVVGTIYICVYGYNVGLPGRWRDVERGVEVAAYSHPTASPARNARSSALARQMRTHWNIHKTYARVRASTIRMSEERMERSTQKETEKKTTKRTNTNVQRL